MTKSKTLPLKIIAFVVVAALGLAACGDDGDDNDDNASGGQDAAAATASSGGAAPVALGEIDGTKVLVDANGSALYSAEQEADGKVLCVGSCTAIWEPVAAGATGSIESDLAAAIGTVERPDGTSQLTYDGVPLYRFTEEGPGQLTGDGVADSFDGASFTWQVASADEGSSDEGSSESSESTEESAPSSGGGYGY